MSTPLINLAINDTHCGSDLALLPQSVKLKDGRDVGYHENKKLEFLWHSWLSMTDQFLHLANGDPFILTLNGDLIEGSHHGSDELVAAKVSQHLTIAMEALSPLVSRAHTVYVTRGTECHTGDWESFLCEKFGLSEAKDFHQYEVNGILIDARHHMPCASNANAEASAMSHLITDTAANCNRTGHPTPRVFLRGHRHLTGDYSDGHSMVIVPGAWQYLSRYCYKKVPNSIPRFSAYALDFRNKPERTLPARHCFCFVPPYEILNS